MQRAIRAALRTGIARQGSTLRDYARPDGSAGSMQTEFRVYGRDGEPVPALPDADREDARRRPRHLVLPALPAGSLGVADPQRRKRTIRHERRPLRGCRAA